jgi:hypothetical protein
MGNELDAKPPHKLICQLLTGQQENLTLLSTSSSSIFTNNMAATYPMVATATEQKQPSNKAICTVINLAN